MYGGFIMHPAPLYIMPVMEVYGVSRVFQYWTLQSGYVISFFLVSVCGACNHGHLCQGSLRTACNVQTSQSLKSVHSSLQMMLLMLSLRLDSGKYDICDLLVVALHLQSIHIHLQLFIMCFIGLMLTVM